MTDEQEVQESIPDAAPAPSPAPAPSEAPLHWTHDDAENEYAKHFAKDETADRYVEFHKDITDYMDGVEFSDDRSLLAVAENVAWRVTRVGEGWAPLNEIVQVALDAID